MKPRLVHSLALALVLGACGGGGSRTLSLVNSPQTPAAQGTVTARFDENGNTRLALEVKHLAPPERVWPSARVSVVWVQAPDGTVHNVGALKVGDNLTGRLETVTPLQDFDLFVTVEELPAVTYPKGPRVLSALVAK